MKDSISIFRELCSKFENSVRVKYSLDDTKRHFLNFQIEKKIRSLKRI